MYKVKGRTSEFLFMLNVGMEKGVKILRITCEAKSNYLCIDTHVNCQGLNGPGK